MHAPSPRQFQFSFFLLMGLESRPYMHREPANVGPRIPRRSSKVTRLVLGVFITAGLFALGFFAGKRLDLSSVIGTVRPESGDLEQSPAQSSSPIEAYTEDGELGAVIGVISITQGNLTIKRIVVNGELDLGSWIESAIKKDSFATGDAYREKRLPIDLSIGQTYRIHLIDYPKAVVRMEVSTDRGSYQFGFSPR